MFSDIGGRRERLLDAGDLFGERLPPIQLFGIGLIIIGVMVCALGR